MKIFRNIKKIEAILMRWTKKYFFPSFKDTVSNNVEISKTFPVPKCSILFNTNLKQPLIMISNEFLHIFFKIFIRAINKNYISKFLSLYDYSILRTKIHLGPSDRKIKIDSEKLKIITFQLNINKTKKFLSVK